MSETILSDQQAQQHGPVMTRFALAVDRFAVSLAEHWLAYVCLFFGIFVLLPFAAPALMALGAEGPAQAIYFMYGFVCHQLPERSWFLFGHKTSYSLAEIGRAFPYNDYLQLRTFVGNEAMGWKMAWSDRMVALYGSLWVGGILYALFHRRLPRLSFRAWLLFAIIPIGVDGLSHMVNDAVAGISGTGFRDTNAWLALVTGNTLPAKFYAGDALGSFNSWARLVTGALTGLASVWFLYAYVDAAMQDLGASARVHVATPRASLRDREEQVTCAARGREVEVQ